MLRAEPLGEIPSETVRVARAAFPKGNLYLRMRDELGVLYEDADFAALFPPLGRPALSPWRLALITIFQFLEGLPDRQAADAVRARLDWKYALSLELTDSGFDFSVLTEFRSRLIEGNQEHLLLDKMLSQFKARDLLKLRGKQRTDSTHVIGAVRRLWRLNLIVETLRAALNQIAHLDSEWLQPRLTSEWVKRYARRVEMERLPTSEQARERYAVEVGQDGFHLLEMLDQDGTEGLRCLEAVGVLRLVWEQQFAVDADSKAVRWKAKQEQPPSSERPGSPYDPDTRFAANRSKTWLGYRVHLSETCDQDSPELITNVYLTGAAVGDVTTLPTIHEQLGSKDFIPVQHLVDGGYLSAEILAAHQDGEIQLIGPAKRSSSWQQRTPGAFTHDDFQIDWANKDVKCPQNFLNASWVEKVSSDGIPTITVKFRKRTCARCPVRSRCTRANPAQSGRTLVLRQEEQYRALNSARTQQQQMDWFKKYALRAGIEGTISQAVRRFDLRHARYWGMAKMRLQALGTAAALNLVRFDAWTQGVPRGATRIPILARISLIA